MTPAQLQKTLFVLGEKIPAEVGKGFYRFHPYNYGPFSAAIYSDAEELERVGLVEIDRQEPNRAWPVYSATPEGLSAAATLEPPDRAARYLADLVAWARTLSFQELVGAIYRAYPEQRKNSVFID